MKTGSTFLQNVVFPSLPDVQTYSYGGGQPFIDLCIAVRRGLLPADAPDTLDGLRALMAGSTRPVQLYSWEGLVGGYLNDYREREMMAGLIKRALPEARALLVVRRQDTLVESLYRQALQTYHFPTVAGFVNRTADGFGSFRPDARANLDVRSLNFPAFVDLYERVFGPENVTVLPYEWLRRAPERFYAGLSEVLGVEVPPPPPGISENRGYSALAARIAFVVNRFYRSPHNPRGVIPLKPLDPRVLLQRGLDRLVYVKGDLIPAAWRQEILALHAEDNRALDARLGLGLKELGYY